MKSMRFSLPHLATLAITLSFAVHAPAQTFTTLANFNYNNGEYPYYGSLVQATNGNYYGVTHLGGAYIGGAVFQITSAGKLTNTYGFCAQSNCADGEEPWSSIILGSDGNFYGTTNISGSGNAGTAFKMTIGGKLVTLYSFCQPGPCSEGAYPVGLMQASNGNFYGTTSNGGSQGNYGTIFEITKSGTFKTLYNFCSKTHCTDGATPLSGLIQASNGNLYGTTNSGGVHGYGVVYEITTTGTYKTRYSFCAQTNCSDGSYPQAGLIQAANGSLYGTTGAGGTSGVGTVFEITPTNQFITLHSFNSTDGANPVAALIQANDGNFYGTAWEGGTAYGGVIYEVSAAGSFSVLYDFCTAPSNCTGTGPLGSLMQATNGTLYGTTTYGGIGNSGTVFSYSLGLSPLVETVPVAGKVGARVIILGDGLTGSTSVTFNGTSAAFTVVSDTTITATVPTGATTGTVSVTTPTGTLNSNPVFQVLK
jgi:uncharacterized repeat protein (TIGR03803 family)